MIQQLDGQDAKLATLQPISLSLPALKELRAKWMVEMAEYPNEKPQIIVNEFVQSGIAGVLDGYRDEPEEDIGTKCESESNFDESDS